MTPSTPPFSLAMRQRTGSATGSPLEVRPAVRTSPASESLASGPASGRTAGLGAGTDASRPASVMTSPNAAVRPASSLTSNCRPPVALATQAIAARVCGLMPSVMTWMGTAGLLLAMAVAAAHASWLQLSGSSCSRMIERCGPTPRPCAACRSACTSGPLPVVSIAGRAAIVFSRLPASGATMASTSPQLPLRRWPKATSPTAAVGGALASAGPRAARTMSILLALAPSSQPAIEPEPSSTIVAAGCCAAAGPARDRQPTTKPAIIPAILEITLRCM